VTRLFLKKKDDGFTFAHITYETIDEARNAVEKLNRRKIGAKNIRVQFGRDNPNPRGDSRDGSQDRNKQDRGSGGNRGGRGGFRGDGDFRKDSDTRRRFDNDNGGRGGGNGRGRGGRDGDRGERGPDRGGFRHGGGR
jgi:RNA recognition motif-containing protein